MDPNDGLRKPGVRIAFWVMLLMCSDHLRSSDIATLGILQIGHFQVRNHGGDI